MKLKSSHHHCLLLSLIILSCYFVAEIHGKRQAKSLVHLSKSTSKRSAGVDTSLFAVDQGNAVDHDDHHGGGDDDQKSLKENDRIGRLPGQPNVNFTQYGGYVTVNKTAGRSLYYYFAEAHYNKDSLPLLLWLNGGPGCSSLAYGAMQELGPFRVHSDGKSLYTNRYSWNYAANVVFLESPAGVGFSYSNTTSDYDKSGDSNTAADNYLFLVNWLERFPEYKGRDFYISGESYAGHYVPQLAHTILYHNRRANKTIINLKGILIGNAVINDESDERGMYEYMGSHALISDRTATAIQNYCDFSPKAAQSDKCDNAMKEVDRDTYYVDIYNIYAPLCTSSNLTSKPKSASVMKFDPCSDYYVEGYLNRRDVQAAMHANVTKLPYDWQPCSDVIEGWADSPHTVLPLLREFMSHGLRVWIFSGDTDARVPVTSTINSLNKMNLSVKTQWHPWYFDGEVGGYTEVYKGDLTFSTVRGAGHQVPSYQPGRALSLIKHFLDGTDLPDTTRYD
ncbi:serine carboxypeptidase-like 40 [Humulus lupulus]|uniref:serine carboxypeptidase-like 40 n=1 Tax=Humulus lupulus TaxID=3486 RepID=UPI002B40C1E1|nr:serine carboxypeptidase-like 40 [Humulus lupulus]